MPVHRETALDLDNQVSIAPMRKYQLSTLFLVTAIIAIAFGSIASRRHAINKINHCSQQIDAAVEDVSNNIYERSELVFERLNADRIEEFRGVRTSDPLHKFVFLVALDSGSSTISPMEIDRHIYLKSRIPSVMASSLFVKFEDRVNVSIRCYSHGLIFSQNVHAEIVVRDAELSEEFVNGLTQRLESIGVTCHVTGSH